MVKFYFCLIVCTEARVLDFNLNSIGFKSCAAIGENGDDAFKMICLYFSE